MTNGENVRLAPNSTTSPLVPSTPARGDLSRLEVALDLLRRGYAVIPAGQDKAALIKWREFQNRLPTEDEVRSWFTQFPTANIAVVTGRISGIVVIDVEAGELDKIDQEKYLIPDTLAVCSGSGGYHYYFRYPANVERVPNKNRIFGEDGPRVDLKGDGGMVIVPPSIHPCGQPYTYPDPDWTLHHDRELAELPSWVLDLLGPQLDGGEGQRLEEDELRRLLAGVAEGQRHDAATRLIGAGLARLPPNKWPGLFWGILHWNLLNRPPTSEEELVNAATDLVEKEAAKRGLNANGILARLRRVQAAWRNKRPSREDVEREVNRLERELLRRGEGRRRWFRSSPPHGRRSPVPHPRVCPSCGAGLGAQAQAFHWRKEHPADPLRRWLE